MTKEEWQNLKVGDFVYSTKTKTKIKREIVKISKDGHTDCISMKALRKTRYDDKLTCYCSNDRSFWSICPQE
jgi:hypothetical protein